METVETLRASKSGKTIYVGIRLHSGGFFEDGSAACTRSAIFLDDGDPDDPRALVRVNGDWKRPSSVLSNSRKS